MSQHVSACLSCCCFRSPSETPLASPKLTATPTEVSINPQKLSFIRVQFLQANRRAVSLVSLVCTAQDYCTAINLATQNTAEPEALTVQSMAGPFFVTLATVGFGHGWSETAARGQPFGWQQNCCIGHLRTLTKVGGPLGLQEPPPFRFGGPGVGARGV